MKKRIKLAIMTITVIVLAFDFIFCGCNSNNGNSEGIAVPVGYVMIKGSFIDGNNSALDFLNKLFNIFVKKSYALDTTMVRKIMVIYGDYSYEITEVIGNSFSIIIKRDLRSD